MDQLRHQLRLLVAVLGLAAAAAACSGESPSPAGAAESATPVDSVIPREVEVARFRAGLTEPAAFTGGAPSRDALVRRFFVALERRDTAALADLLLTRAEFAYLYYPSHPEAQPPYDLSPGLMWFLLESRSNQGKAHLLEDRAGRPLHYAGYRCAARTRQGNNVVWTGCVVRRREAGSNPVTELLFGPIVQRGGRFKFVSYTNKL